MSESSRPEASAPDAFTLAAFTVAVVLGGGNFIAVRFSNRELDPFWGAGLRFTLAATVFVTIALALRLRWPTGRHLALTLAYGGLNFGLSYALLYWALVRVTAGFGAVILAVVPLITILLAVAHGMERLKARTLVGSMLSLIGIIVMTVRPGDVDLPITGLLAMLVAAVTVGEGVIVSKKVSGYHPVMTNAVGMTVGAVILLAISAFAAESWLIPSQTEVIWSVAYLILLGSVGLFVLFLLVVRKWTASATSYSFVLFPVVTMLLGAWIADEPITYGGVTGAVLVMSGVWFGALSPGARRAPDLEQAEQSTIRT
jgi:drug/metabolite transporter (DMT)-like permease